VISNVSFVVEREKVLCATWRGFLIHRGWRRHSCISRSRFEEYVTRCIHAQFSRCQQAKQLLQAPGMYPINAVRQSDRFGRVGHVLIYSQPNVVI
jgi:hypothetical protein